MGEVAYAAWSPSPTSSVAGPALACSVLPYGTRGRGGAGKG